MKPTLASYDTDDKHNFIATALDKQHLHSNNLSNKGYYSISMVMLKSDSETKLALICCVYLHYRYMFTVQSGIALSRQSILLFYCASLEPEQYSMYSG